MKNKPYSVWQKIRIWGLRIIALLAAAAAVLLGALTVTEYKPAAVQELEVSAGAQTAEGEHFPDADSHKTFTIMTWNIGYGALGENADCFLDGGTGVLTASKAQVEENLHAIAAVITSVDPDILFLQEIDRDSKRSRHVNELEEIAAALPEENYVFANNFKVLYLPYPIPTWGKVDSGMATFSKFTLTDAQRIQLPCPFSWPMRIVNLKRCLEISRIPLDNAEGRQLVLINLHLEAYDSGEGKIAQTKMLAEVMQAEADKGNYVIAGGDFNQIFSSADGSAWPAQDGTWTPGELDVTQFADGWQFVMDSRTPSCRSLDQPYAGADKEAFQFYLIDGFIVSDNVKITNFRTEQLDFKNSDHNPVILEVELA